MLFAGCATVKRSPRRDDPQASRSGALIHLGGQQRPFDPVKEEHRQAVWIAILLPGDRAILGIAKEEWALMLHVLNRLGSWGEGEGEACVQKQLLFF